MGQKNTHPKQRKAPADSVRGLLVVMYRSAWLGDDHLVYHQTERGLPFTHQGPDANQVGVGCSFYQAVASPKNRHHDS